ncbi:ferredoxin [Actinomadura meridiana]|uniref:Ferredoxin n=1 Tax=Actinomadura meridiana TaxID=559626 RepID=A0ABP8CJE0_9ACTN
MHITTDTDSCIGSGQCALALPEIFDQDDTEGKVLLINDSPDRELHDDVREAAYRCPMQAITVTEAEPRQEGP